MKNDFIIHVYDRNYFLYFLDCMHYMTKKVNKRQVFLWLINGKKKKTNFTLEKIITPGLYMSNNRSLRPASGLKRNPCKGIGERGVSQGVFNNSRAVDLNHQ